MGKKHRAPAAEHGPGTPTLNRAAPVPEGTEAPTRPARPADAIEAPLTAAELRKQELEECQAVINRALERYQAQLVTQRVETVGENGAPRVQFNTTIVSR